MLREVNQGGTAILLVEQFVPLALANTSRAYVLGKGQVMMSGSSSEMAGDPDLVASYLGGRVGEQPVVAIDPHAIDSHTIDARAYPAESRRLER